MDSIFDITPSAKSDLLVILGSYPSNNWVTTNQMVYKADPVIQRAR